MLQNMLHRTSVIGLLAVATLASTPTSALAKPHQRGAQQSTANAIARGNHARAVNNIHQSIYQIYLGNPGYSYGDGYSNGDYGYWPDPQMQAPQTQISNQQATANAVAAGDNSTAISNIDQSNYQNTYDSPTYWDEGYGYWSDPQTQISSQQANANAAAIGDNSTAISNIDQSNYQNDYGSPVYWDGGYSW